jgi:hypothetical protein
MRRFVRLVVVPGILCAAVFLTGCHSAHIEVAVENRTGAPVRLLEVDYPSASFGSDQLATGSTMHYRIQIQGTGLVKVQYTAADGRQPQIQGPALAEHQEGTLEVILLPEGKAEFHPQLSKPD